MHFSFILVRTSVPENIGATARALKTMGFSDLRLVNAADHLCNEAKTLAHGSLDILENAKTFSNLKDAIADIDFVVGTTIRKRTKNTDYHPIEKLPYFLSDKKNSIKSVGIVFGCEESGLSNSELSCCDILSYIKIKSKFPSLNLSQAVMIYSYVLSSNTDSNFAQVEEDRNEKSWKVLKSNISQQLNELGYTSEDLIFTRIMERIALLKDTDINLLHSIIAAIKDKKDS